MAATVPGYEYDIFISYRQKDNGSDQWVTKFVQALNEELESTFKEDISVYFDENPHDGLLETHDVGKSLTEKVKCLVFIPIVSQTYCDPNCFAWQNEFIAFRDFAKTDKYGIDIKTGNGNIAKRVLPVRIHEIDEADQQLFEKEIDGVMRPIDFIYKSTGVNRPLRLSEEHPDDNINRTIYRDQINKVANAIKEILSSIQGKEPGRHSSEKDLTSSAVKSIGSNSRPVKRNNVIFGFIGAALFLLVAYFFYWSNNKSQAEIQLIDKSVAVLYFDNMSGDPEQEYISDGFTEEIIAHLVQIEGLKVISSNSVKFYKGKPLNIKKISEELGVSTVLEGSFRRSGNQIKIIAKLINAKTDETIWSHTFDRDLDDIFAVQTDIALEIASKFAIEITPETNLKIGQIPTSNIEAYEYYLKGKHFHDKKFLYTMSIGDLNKSEEYFLEAIKLDSNFALAYAGLADLYDSGRSLDMEYYDSLRDKNVNKAYSIDSISAYVNSVMVLKYLRPNPDNDSAYYHIVKVHDLNQNTSEDAFSTAGFYRNIGSYKKSYSFGKKAVELDPLSALNYLMVGTVSRYFGEDSSQVAENYFMEAINLDPDYIYALRHLALFYVDRNQKFKLEEQIKKLQDLDWDESNYIMGLYHASFGRDSLALSYSDDYRIYSLLGKHELAISQMDSVFSISPHRSRYLHLISSSIYDQLRGLPGFEKIVRMEKVKYDMLIERYPVPVHD